MMRAAYSPGTTSRYVELGPPFPEGRLQKLKKAFNPPWLPHYVAYIRQRLPYYLGGQENPCQPLLPMLKALKSATESYLETAIMIAGITVPFYITKEFQFILDSARLSASLGGHKFGGTASDAAGMYAMYAYGIGVTECSLAPGMPLLPEQLILTVEYSKAALTAMLIYEECAVPQEKRLIHDTNLGSRHDGSEDHRSSLESTLRDILELPIKDGFGGEDLTYISNLVVFGESAGDLHLHEALKRVLGEQYGQLMERSVVGSAPGAVDDLFATLTGVPRVNAVHNGSDRIDPLFAAARGKAYMNFPVDDGEGCTNPVWVT